MWCVNSTFIPHVLPFFSREEEDAVVDDSVREGVVAEEAAVVLGEVVREMVKVLDQDLRKIEIESSFIKKVRKFLACLARSGSRITFCPNARNCWPYIFWS